MDECILKKIKYEKKKKILNEYQKYIEKKIIEKGMIK